MSDIEEIDEYYYGVIISIRMNSRKLIYKVSTPFEYIEVQHEILSKIYSSSRIYGHMIIELLEELNDAVLSVMLGMRKRERIRVEDIYIVVRRCEYVDYGYDEEEMVVDVDVEVVDDGTVDALIKELNVGEAMKNSVSDYLSMRSRKIKLSELTKLTK